MFSIIAAALAFLGSMIGIGVSARNASNANKEKQQAREFEEDQIRQQNIYNSPAEQIKRIKAAGGNPNAYFNGVSGGTQVQTASYGDMATPAISSDDIQSLFKSLGGLSNSILTKDMTELQMQVEKDELNARSAIASAQAQSAQAEALQDSINASILQDSYSNERYKNDWRKKDVEIQILENDLQSAILQSNLDNDPITGKKAQQDLKYQILQNDELRGRLNILSESLDYLSKNDKYEFEHKFNTTAIPQTTEQWITFYEKQIKQYQAQNPNVTPQNVAGSVTDTIINFLDNKGFKMSETTKKTLNIIARFAGSKFL